LKHKLYKLILKIWDNEHLPTQWNEGIVCPIYKKREGLKSNNCRPITLLNIAYKILAMLLNNILYYIDKKKIGRMSNGLPPKYIYY